MATPPKSANSSPTHCSVAGSVELGELGTPPSRITGFSRTVSSAVMALVLPSVQGGGASTRTSLAVRTDQIRGTHGFSVSRAASSCNSSPTHCSVARSVEARDAELTSLTHVTALAPAVPSGVMAHIATRVQAHKKTPPPERSGGVRRN